MSAKYTFLAWDTPIDNAPLKLALLQLANNADDNGFSFYSISKMALACGMSEKTFQRKIKEMENMGILTVERRANRPSLYSLVGDEMGVTLCRLQESEATESLGEGSESRPTPTESPLVSDRESLVPNSTPKTLPNKTPNNDEFLTKITEYWNDLMTTQPKVDLLDGTTASKDRIKAINKIKKEYPDYKDPDFFQGYFYRLSKLSDFQWRRDNQQVKFSQAVNIKKFAENLEVMRMRESETA